MNAAIRSVVWACLLMAVAASVGGASSGSRTGPGAMWGDAYEPTLAMSAGVRGLLTRLRPLDDAVACSLPIRSLASWDIGVGPADLVAVISPMVQRAAPDLAGRVEAGIAQLEASVGQGSVRELVEALGSTTSLVVLPAETGVDGWPAPRPVWVFREADERIVRSRVDDVVPWIAGSIAPATCGVYGASVGRRTQGEVDLVILQLDSLAPGPLPRPTIGFADGVVFFSSTDSGVLEVQAALRFRSPQPHTASVEEFRVDAAALSRAFAAADERLRGRLDRSPRARAWWRVGRAAVDGFSQLGLVTGRTTKAADGRLHVQVDVIPPEPVREAQPGAAR